MLSHKGYKPLSALIGGRGAARTDPRFAMADMGIRITNENDNGLGWLLRQNFAQLSPEGSVHRVTLNKPRGMDAHDSKEGPTKTHEAGHDAVTVRIGGNNRGGVPV
eukprot:15158214-Alexandrium_andersonii.AAC.1